MAAGQENSQAIEAMEKLCRAYWYPLYAFCRRMGHSPHDAQDLTQSFFVQLLESELVTKASPQKGRFRSFLLACFKHFIFSEQDRARAQKRGGGQKILSLDQQTAEGKFANEPQDPFDPETQFERAWAYTVVEKALALMEEDYATPEKRLLLDNLKGFIVGGTSSSTYAQIAEKLSTSEAAVKMMVQRLRQRYRNCLRR
ncbi:MAG: sigma-70 family RNA polymerase sigma factor, partial [Verrucomicrobiota bacterium]